MALTESKMVELGSSAPNFHIQDTVSNNYYSLDDLKSDIATVIIFMCNHCPYVIHINQELINIANKYKNSGVSFVAISSNDVVEFPEDSPDKMSIVAKVLKFPFPYLYDKHQEVAKKYGAECTPDFFIYDGETKLFYRGRLDASSPGNGISVTGSDIRKALDLIIAKEPPPYPQYPSMGCNIKWKK